MEKIIHITHFPIIWSLSKMNILASPLLYPQPFQRRCHRCPFIGCNHIHSEKSIEVENPHTIDLSKASLYPPPLPQSKYSLLKSSHPMRILLYKPPHPCTPLPSLDVHPLHFSPNLRVTTLLQSLVSSIPNLHNHFPSKALLCSFLLSLLSLPQRT